MDINQIEAASQGFETLGIQGVFAGFIIAYLVMNYFKVRRLETQFFKTGGIKETLLLLVESLKQLTEDVKELKKDLKEHRKNERKAPRRR